MHSTTYKCMYGKISNVHSQKSRTPQAKHFFRMLTRRLAASFDASTRSVALTNREKFPRRAMCVLMLYFFENPQKRPGAKVLQCYLCDKFCSWYTINLAEKTNVEKNGTLTENVSFFITFKSDMMIPTSKFFITNITN